MSKPRPAFRITSVSMPSEDGYVTLGISFEGGAMILPFRSTLPETAILAQVRAEVRRRMTDPDARDRLMSLLGDHDL